MSNADWWAKQLGAQPQAPHQSVPVTAPRQMNNPMPPSQQPMAQFQPPQPQQQLLLLPQQLQLFLVYVIQFKKQVEL